MIAGDSPARKDSSRRSPDAAMDVGRGRGGGHLMNGERVERNGWAFEERLGKGTGFRAREDRHIAWLKFLGENTKKTIDKNVSCESERCRQRH